MSPVNRLAAVVSACAFAASAAASSDPFIDTLQDGSWGMHSYRQGVFRKGVTSVRVQLAAWDSYVRGRLFLNFWS